MAAARPRMAKVARTQRCVLELCVRLYVYMCVFVCVLVYIWVWEKGLLNSNELENGGCTSEDGKGGT